VLNLDKNGDALREGGMNVGGGAFCFMKCGTFWSAEYERTGGGEIKCKNGRVDIAMRMLTHKCGRNVKKQPIARVLCWYGFCIVGSSVDFIQDYIVNS
jgi:hypothetical protein